MIHVPDTSTEANRAFIEELHTLYTSAPAFRSRVDVHLARSVQGRQFNAWRNAARALARTNYIFALDVDFALCTDVRGAVLSNPILRATLADGTGALVVPAFEYTNLTDGTHSDTFPRQKRVSVLGASSIDYNQNAATGPTATGARWTHRDVPPVVGARSQRYELRAVLLRISRRSLQCSKLPGCL